MKNKMKFAVALTLGLASSQALAWPDRPVMMIVANAPGGPVDVVVRLIARELEARWKQPVVIDNKVGGSGMVAARALARSEPDGYTLGTIFGAYYTTLPFVTDVQVDPVKDLDAVTILAKTPFVYVVNQDSPYRTWQDVVADAKRREVTVASYSIGTAFHLSWEQTARAAGIKALYAPASAASKTHTDLVSGQADIGLDALSSAKGMIDAGRLRAIAVTGNTRLAALPDTPSLTEQGMPDDIADPWFAVSAPKGTPDKRIEQIQQDIWAVLSSDALRERLASMGMVPAAGTPAEMLQTIEREQAMMAPLVKELDIRL
jgi:tripartite-type tricarboxylate transporter receptor subunit TctC